MCMNFAQAKDIQLDFSQVHTFQVIIHYLC